jgi:hypothetical protein
MDVGWSTHREEAIYRLCLSACAAILPHTAAPQESVYVKALLWMCCVDAVLFFQGWTGGATPPAYFRPLLTFRFCPEASIEQIRR